MEQKILDHMNKDHDLALEDYLVAFGKESLTGVSNIQLKALETDKMLLSYSKAGVTKEKSISIEPPMKNVVSDSRTTLIQMAKDAAATRGYSHKQIKKFVYPNTLLHFFVLISDLAVFLGLIKSDIIYDTVLSGYFGVSETNAILSFFKQYNNAIAYSVIATHLCEFSYVLFPKLAKYRVPISLRFVWFISNILEGFGTLQRFKELED